jgi:hypothetical protein
MDLAYATRQVAVDNSSMLPDKHDIDNGNNKK